MTAHCATCNCADDGARPPAVSSTWARRQALLAAEAAVRAAKDSRKQSTSPADSRGENEEKADA